MSFRSDQACNFFADQVDKLTDNSISRCFATATDAHRTPTATAISRYSAPASPSGSGHAMSPLQIGTNGANKWTVPSALPTQSKSPPQLTAWALSAQRAANTMYRARSLLQKIGRDLIRMNAAMSWTMRSVRVNPASALRSQTTCSQPTWSPPRNRQHYHLTNTRSPVPLLASLRCTRSGITELAECCRAATPLASLSNVSRSRPTTDQHRCFVAAWLMLI